MKAATSAPPRSGKPAGSKSKPPLDREALERVAELFRVFSEATRLAILQALMPGARSVNDLVEALGTSQANISKQLRILYDARVLSRNKRGNQVFYAISDEIVRPLCELVCGKLNRDAERSSSYEFSI